MKTTFDNHLKIIIESNNDRNLAVFIGAGISLSSSDKMPSWSYIMDQLKAELGDTTELDFLKIAQLYYLEYGEHTYYKKLR